MCHYSEREFRLRILKSNGKCFYGTVSCSSAVGLIGSDVLNAQHEPLLCVFKHKFYWCECSCTADEHGAY